MRKLENYIEKLKQKIIDAKNKHVFIDNNTLIYHLKEKKEKNIEKPNVNTLGELGRALAVIHLLTDLKIPHEKINIEEQIEVGSAPKRIDITIDIDDSYHNRKCTAIAECKTTIQQVKDNSKSFVNQLYKIAHLYDRDTRLPYPLILIAYEIFFDDTDNVILDFAWFNYPEILSFLQTKQLSPEEVLHKNSLFAYRKSPRVEGNNIYFDKEPLTNKDLIDIANPNEFKKLLKEGIHQKLRHYGMTEEDAFEVVLNLLLAKTYDEINAESQKYQFLEFQVKPEDYVKTHDFYNRIKELYQKALIDLIGENPKEARKKEILIHDKKEEILLDIVPYLQRIRLRSIRLLKDDALGDIFLDFLHSIFKQSRGMFFTHPNIATFMCKAIGVEEIKNGIVSGERKYILDPSCGSGTFLIEALRLIFRDFPIDKIKDYAKEIFYGTDNSETATKLCKVNMVIHGDGSANIYTRDAIGPLGGLPFPFTTSDNIEKYNDACVFERIKDDYGVDFIITNPPFSLEIKQNSHNHFRIVDFLKFKNGVSLASECLFIERWFQLLNPNGRLSAVMPFSILDGKDYFDARLLFLTFFKITAVIGLPEHAFSPHARQKTALIFALRRDFNKANQLFNLVKNGKIEEFIKAIENEQILFFDAQDIGYRRIKKAKTVITEIIDNNDLNDNLANVVRNTMKGNFNNTFEGIVVKTIGDIYKNDQNLRLTPNYVSITQINYKDTFKLSDEWDIVTVDKTIDNGKDILICETGDITQNGTGIITPQRFETPNSEKKARLTKKLKEKGFGKLKEGDIIIAPVRPYLNKIAVVTKTAEKFLYSSQFIVLRRKRQADIIKSFELFLTLRDPVNNNILNTLSSTGKSGYPKIKDKMELLNAEFYKIPLPPREDIEEMAKLYDDIYKKLWKID